MTQSDLSRRAEQICRLEDQKAEITEDIKAAYAAAASVGFNGAALKQAIKVARMSAIKRARFDEAQVDFEMYLAELDGKSNVVPMREAAE